MKEIYRPLDSGVTRRDFLRDLLTLSAGSAAFALLAAWGSSRVVRGVINGETLDTCSTAAFNPNTFQKGLRQKRAFEQAVNDKVRADGLVTEAEGESLVAAAKETIAYQDAREKCWSDIREAFNKTILPAGASLLSGILAWTRYQDLQAMRDIDMVN